MSDHFQRAVEIFVELCELTPEEQAEGLARIEREDPALRDEVAEILLGDRDPDERLDRQAEDFVPWETVLLGQNDGPVAPEVLERLTERGRSLDRYSERGEVGRGGMGTVYRIWDEDLERDLAVKMLGTGEATPSSLGRRRLQRFLGEARVTGQLDHPGIVPVHDIGIDSKGRAYFTMKYVRGRTLKEVFERVAGGDDEWTQTRALGVLLRVCEAMSYAHTKGVVHRDLKPSNIMVGRFGEVYVMDWGVARLRSRPDGRDLRPRRAQPDTAPTGEIAIDSPVITMDGTVVGTPYFMSPEQARGGIVDERGDVYAIGAMLFTLVAGRPPYGDASAESTPHEILERVIEGPPAPSGAMGTAPPEIEAICRKAMARAAEERYADVGELGDDLRAYLEGRVVQAHRTGAVVELRKWMVRNRALASAIGIAILILIAGLFTSLVLADRAHSEREAAQASAAAAARERNRALRLGSVMTMDYTLREGLDELWPATPEHLDAYAEWIDASRAIEALYPQVTAELEELRVRARPVEEEEQDRQGTPHSDFAALYAVERELAVAQRAQAVRTGRSAPAAHTLNEQLLPSDPGQLNDLAWPLVDPERSVFGREAEGLAIARHAAEALGSQPVPGMLHDTLAWAFFANGLDDEASAAMQAALQSEERADEFRRSADRLYVAIEHARSGARLAELEARRSQLEQIMSTQAASRFEDPEDQDWYDSLSRFVATFESLFGSERGVARGTSAEYGWEIARRMAWAEKVEELTLTGSDAARRWRRAVSSIADESECPVYAGLRIEPQPGLLPIDLDPYTGLWEFVVLQTGSEPVRGNDGELVIDADTGLVLVLIPGGTFTMGAQRSDARRPNYDLLASASEGPTHEVQLAPFFLSKYEMTQGQWSRMTGENPSFYSPEYGLEISLTHPVERASWTDSTRVCRWLGLELPTEAQWEYAARGTTGSVWWTGDERDSLAGHVNLADQAARRIGAPWPQIDDWPELDDGYPVHAPVDHGLANPFGLHAVHGNVREWCRDRYEPDFYGRSERMNPVNDAAQARDHVSRGGSFRSRSYSARSASRQANAPETTTSEVGLRPARALEPR